MAESVDEYVQIDHMPLDYFRDFPILKYDAELCDYEAVCNLALNPGDIVLNTYPKCGTTWAQYMIWEIFNNGAVPPDTNDIMFKQFPFLEFAGVDSLLNLPEPRCMKLHLPWRLTPKSKQAKYITILRNPFDVCISYYHHLSNIDLAMAKLKLNFNTYVEDFVAGKVPFGDYFDHIIPWYEHRNDPNVLFLYFEDTKKNPHETVLQIAEFLGMEYRNKLEKDSQMMSNILKHTDFKYLKENMTFRVARSLEAVQKMGATYIQDMMDPVKNKDDKLFMDVDFFRKGEVGGSKTVLSEEQWKWIDEKINQRVTDPELKAKMRRT